MTWGRGHRTGAGHDRLGRASVDHRPVQDGPAHRPARNTHTAAVSPKPQHKTIPAGPRALHSRTLDVPDHGNGPCINQQERTGRGPPWDDGQRK